MTGYQGLHFIVDTNQGELEIKIPATVKCFIRPSAKVGIYAVGENTNSGGKNNLSKNEKVVYKIDN